jgi:hypothetical protein
MKLHSRYQFKGDPEGVMTTSYEFDTQEEARASGLIDDPRRTTCYMSSGKCYVGGHFEPLKLKKVFICSRYRADDKHTTDDNVRRALFACSYAAAHGYAPYAPHLYLPRCLDDSNPLERAQGMAAGREFLTVCDEVWQWGATVSAGMAAELAYAKELGIPIQVFNSIGIPYEQWNGVKYPNQFLEDAR